MYFSFNFRANPLLSFNGNLLQITCAYIVGSWRLNSADDLDGLPNVALLNCGFRCVGEDTDKSA